MQTKLKRSLSLLLALGMAMGLLCGSAWAVETEKSEDISLFSAQLTLDELRAKFPSGKYWNHAGNPGSSYAKNNQDGYTSTPCSQHGTVGTAQQTCNGFAPNGTQLSWQCMGYAEKLGYDSTGYNPRNNTNGWQTYTNSSALDSLKAGDIVRYKSDKHSIFVTDVNGNTVTYTDCNSDGHCKIRWDQTISKATLKSSFTHLRSAPKRIEDSNPSTGNSPAGYLDSVTSEAGKIFVRGWAVDMDDPTKAIEVHFYAVQNGERTGLGIAIADNYRPDAQTVYANIGDYHGFSATINTNLTGDVQVEAYGINVGSGENSMLTNSPKTVFVDKDTAGPVISNVEVTDTSASGYTVSCEVSDNVAIAQVRFATWTENNGQDDIVWYDAEVFDGRASCKISVSDHNDEKNCVYQTHIYAYDLAGNSTGYPVSVYLDAKEPVISDVQTVDISSSGYTVVCKISDDTEISRVRFATWTENNGQDDITWYDANMSGDTAEYRVNIADHNNQTNCVYLTHIYAYDSWGNVRGYPVAIYIDGNEPVISDVEIVDSSETGYTVKCTVKDDHSEISRVQFPTWCGDDSKYTDNDDWCTDSALSGKLEDGKYVYHVNISDYKGQTGLYHTDIYAWDEYGNRSECYPVQVTIKKNHKHTYTSSVKKKPTCTELGTMLYVCNDCDDSYEEEIPATGHLHTELRNVKEANCAQEGYDGDIYCKDCNEKLSSGKVIAKSSHTWNAGEVTKNATCTLYGVKTYTCTICKEVRTEEIPATGHQHSEIRNVAAATCDKEGYTGDTYCKDCNAKIVSGKTVPRTEHSWDAGKITAEATSNKKGTKTYICVKCGATKTEEIPMVSTETVISIGNVSGTLGSNVTVPVSITKNPGIAGFAFDIGYDAEVLTLKEVKLADQVTGTLTRNGNALSWFADENFTADGILFSLTFSISEEAAAQDTKVTLSMHNGKSNLVDENSEAISASFQAGTVKLISYLLGDLTGDQEITIADVVKLNRYVIGKVTLTATEKVAADVTKDGDITIADVVKLNRYVIGKVETFSKGSPLHTMSNPDVEISVGSMSAAPGERIAVPVNITKNSGIAGAALEFKLPAGVELQSITTGEVFEIGTFTQNGTVVSWYTGENVTKNGALVYLNIVAPKMAGTYQITASLKDGKVSNLVNEDSENVAAKFIMGSVQVKEGRKDNSVTASDKTFTVRAKVQTWNISAKAKDGAVLTYKSNNKSITVDKNGKVTVAKNYIGKATITISAAATTNYNAAVKQIYVTVNPTGTKLSSVTSAKTGQLTIKWAKNAAVTGYQVQYATSSKFTGAKTLNVKSNKTVTSTLSKLKQKQKYYVRIRTYKTVGKVNYYSAWSAAKSATVKGVTAPAAVKLTSVKSAKAGEMTVKWGKNAKAGGYQLQYATASNFKGAKTVTINKAATTSITVKKLTKGKKYYVRVRTYQKVSGKTYYSAWSASKNVTIKK